MYELLKRQLDLALEITLFGEELHPDLKELVMSWSYGCSINVEVNCFIQSADHMRKQSRRMQKRAKVQPGWLRLKIHGGE